MLPTGSKARFSLASLRCREALPSTVTASSLVCGWTSVLLERHRVEPTYEPFHTLPTPDHTIVVMTKGEQELASFNTGIWREAAYRPGTVGMTPGGGIDRLRRNLRGTRAPFEKVNLYIPQQAFLDVAEHYRRAGHRRPESHLEKLSFQDPVIAEVASALLRGVEAGAPDLYAEAAIQWLATHLLSVHGGGVSTEAPARPVAMTDKRLSRVLDYMHANYADPISLESLAAEAAISKFHFTRLFRLSTGKTPHDFLVQIRLEAAIALLRTTELSVKAIAAQCGFARANYFATVFSKHVGISPTLYRHTLYHDALHLRP